MKTIVEHLSHLVNVNRDAEAGFREAAETVQNSELETLFSGYASRHAGFATELDTEIRRLGGGSEAESTHSGGVGSAIQRGWLELKSALTGHSPASMISACEQGEESAYVAYLDATDAIGGGQIHTLIQKQADQVKEFRTRLTRLVGEAKDGVDFQKNE